MHVHGFEEEGTTTTPFDMVVLDALDRYHLAINIIDRVSGLAVSAAHIKQQFRDKLLEHTRYVREHGEDMPEIQGFVWPRKTGTEAGQLASRLLTRAIIPIKNQVPSYVENNSRAERWILQHQVRSVRHGRCRQPTYLFAGEVTDIGDKTHLTIKDMDGKIVLDRTWPAPRKQERFWTISWGWVDQNAGRGGLAAIGHRVVHGGSQFVAPVRLKSQDRRRTGAPDADGASAPRGMSGTGANSAVASS